MNFLVSYQQLHCEIAFPTFIVEALVLLVGDIILNDVFLVSVNQLFDIVKGLGVAEPFRPQLLVDSRALLTVVRVYHRDHVLLVLIFLELV